MLIVGILLASCSGTKFVSDGQYMLNKVEVKKDEGYPDVNISKYKSYVRQRGNQRWFSALKVPLGIFSFRTVLDTSPHALNLYVDLHMRTVTQLCHRFGHAMSRRHCGYILNMSSMSCWMPMPGIALYAATKAYIRVFSRALALELSDEGVSVMVACPGGIATDLFGLPPRLQRLGVQLGALSTPQKFVQGALLK